MYLSKKSDYISLIDWVQKTERPFELNYLLFPTKTSFQITMYLSKKSDYMLLIDWVWKTERPIYKLIDIILNFLIYKDLNSDFLKFSQFWSIQSMKKSSNSYFLEKNYPYV